MTGRYEILHKMAEGGMGSIYQVRHRLLDVVRVAKVLRPQLAGKEEWRNRFLSEARLASRLSHRAIAQLHDFEVDADGAWMIMEYIRGHDLGTVLKRCGPPSVDLAIEIALQGLDALSYIHQAELVHRDISPDNLMVTLGHGSGPELKLIDLGIAKRLGNDGSSTVVGTFLGKYQYSSPEQLESASGVDYRSDIYSFGLVLYELLTGVYAFRGESAQELAAAHWFQPPRAFSETDPEGRVTPELREIVLKSLEKDPKNRFSTAGGFKEALEAIASAIASPGTSTAAELEKIFEACDAVEGPRLSDETIASTQNRIDRVFGASRSSTSVPEETPEQQAAALLAVAQGQMAVGDWNVAVTRLNQAAQLDPENAEIRAALSRAETHAAREAQIKVATEKIEELLSSGDLEEAGRRLKSAAHTLGDAERLKALQEDLDERISERGSQVDSLLARAERMSRSGRLEAALEVVDEALGVDPGNDLARTVKRELQQDLVRRHSLADSLAGVEKELASGNLDQAEELLRNIDDTFGDASETAPLWERLRSGRSAAAATLIAKARRSLAHQDWSDAKSALQLALQHQPTSEEAQDLLNEAESAAAREAKANHAAETVESLLEAEKLDSAWSYFQEHQADLDEHTRKAPLEERLQRSLKERERRVEGLLRQANRKADAGQIEEALDLLRTARDLDPRRTDVQDERSRLKAMLATQREVESVVDTIRELVEAGDLEDASSTLAAAQAQHGKDEILTGLQAEIDRLQKRKREQKLTQIMTRAQELKAAGDWDLAAQTLREALDLDAANTTARQQLADVEAEIARESRRGEAMSEIAALLDQDRLDEAKSRLDETLVLLDESEGLARLEGRIQRAFERRDQVEGHLARAGNLKREGNYKAAILEVVEAQKVDPGADVEELMAELRELESRGHKLDKHVRRAETLIQRGDFDEAQDYLTQTQAEFGDDVALIRVWQKLADARKEEHQAKVTELVEAASSWREAGDLKLALSTISDAVELDPSNEQAQALLQEIEAELDQRKQSRAQITEKLELLELGIDDQVRRSAEVSQRHEQKRSGSRLWLVLAAVVLLGAGGFFGWRFLTWSATLTIAPDPAADGLSIWVGGSDSGQATPGAVEIRGRKGATVGIELRDADRTVADASFVLGPEMESTWAPRVPVRRRIASSPTGARVAFDGDWLAEPTPVEVELDPDPTAPHEIRLELEGYDPKVAELTLESWSETLVIELQEKAKPGTLLVRAPFPVQLKTGTEVSSGRVHEIELAAGEHQIELSAPELSFFRRRTVQIRSSEQTVVSDFPAIAKVWVFAVPGNATLSIDGRRVGDLPREVRLATGSHRLGFNWPGKNFADSVQILAGTTKVSSDGTQIVVD